MEFKELTAASAQGKTVKSTSLVKQLYTNASIVVLTILTPCMLSFLTSCTISFSNVSTHGLAEDVGDNSPKTDTQASAELHTSPIPL